MSAVCREPENKARESGQQKSLLGTLVGSSLLHWGLCPLSPGCSLKTKENMIL